MDDIKRWESATSNTWISQDFDVDLMLKLNPIIIAQNILIVVINGAVAYTTIRHPKLYSSLLAGASTRILFSLCIVYIVLGVGQLIIRALLQVREAWSEASCIIHALLNCFVVSDIVFHLVAVTLDQTLSIVWLRRISASTAWWFMSACHVAAGIHTMIHFLPPSRVYYGTDGTWCITTGWASWVGKAAITVILSATITMFACYAVIFLRIRRAVVAKSKALPASGAHFSVLAHSSLTQHAIASSSDKESRSTAHGSDPPTVTPTHVSATRKSSMRRSASSLRPAFVAVKASSIKRRNWSKQMGKENQLQRRIVKRGALALMSACLNFIPILTVCLWTTITARRPNAILSMTVPLGIFLNAIFDPVIAMSQDKILRRAVLELFWLRAPKESTESDAAIGEPKTRAADNQFVSVIPHDAPSEEESQIEQ